MGAAAMGIKARVIMGGGVRRRISRNNECLELCEKLPLLCPPQLLLDFVLFRLSASTSCGLGGRLFASLGTLQSTSVGLLPTLPSVAVLQLHHGAWV
jgi:hypothetical protein